ncbi:MAG TPA: hypothetical protein VIU12_02750 [Chryseolinea sp.]
MKTTHTLIIALLFNIVAVSAKAEGPLHVTAPPDWSVKYDDSKGIQFYSAKKTGAKNLVLMFSRWPASNDPKQIPVFIDQMGKAFAEQAKNTPELKGIDTTYTVEPLKGDSFSGSMIRFKFQEGIQTMFMISNGDGIWNGQYTGPESDWKDALKILTTLKIQG